MNLPTKITVARLVLIPVFVALYLINFPYHEFIATGIFIVASLTDWLDGHLARKYNLVTDLGKFLDPVADKVLVASALILVATIGEGVLQTCIIVASIVILARELIITCFRTIAATKKVVMAADMLGKIKTTTQLIGLIFYLPHLAFYAINPLLGDIIKYIGFGFLMVATFFTILSACNYIIKNKQVLVDEKKVEKDAE